MNERIRMLADKAHAETYQLYLDRLSKEFAGNVIFYDMFNQKFAELIVRECLNHIDKIRDACDADDEVQQALGVVWAGLAIAKHFGVEQ